MRRTLIGLLVIICTSSRDLAAKPPSPEYELLFADEFEGDSLDTTVWSPRTGPRMDGLNRAENVSVSGGALHVAVRIDSISGKATPTGGGVISRTPFGYGYYESRSKPFMAGTGVHSSFWQAGGGSNANNRIFEIDSYEIDSGSSLGCNNLYVHVCPRDLREIPWPLRMHVPWKAEMDGWFMDGYEYSPDGVIFYDNGQEVARVEWPDLTAQQVVWLTGLNGCGKVDAGKLPGETVFDYFRYYAKDHPGITLLPNGSFEYNQDKIDAHKPVAWTVTGSTTSVEVTRGDAAHDAFFLRIGNDKEPFGTTVLQTLEHIRNGDYMLTAKARASAGLQSARVRVTAVGGRQKTASITAAPRWTTIEIPVVSVVDNAASISIEAEGSAGKWLEIDDVRFMKPPLAGHRARDPLPLLRDRTDPVWHALQHPMNFPGDRSFCFFDRNVGLGDAITVSFAMKPSRRGDVCPIARLPKKGTDGWMVLLTGEGDVVFRIGSEQSHTDVEANADYQPGQESRVACVFDRGAATIYVDGRRLATKTGIPQSTNDTTEPGRLGTVNDAFMAVGEMIVANDQAARHSAESKKLSKYTGSLRDVRVYNRALDAAEIQALGMPARR